MIYSSTDDILSERTIHDEIRERIAAISLIHDRLYRSSNLDNIPLGSYLADLANYIVKTFKQKTISLSCTGGDFAVKSRVSAPCGLIINELLTNSLKYAFENTTTPATSITIEKRNGNITINYRDNGRGLPADYNHTHAKTLGMMIVRRLVAQLKGEHSINNENGFTFSMSFTPPGGVCFDPDGSR